MIDNRQLILISISLYFAIAVPCVPAAELDYLLITNEELAPAFSELVKWRCRSGKKAKIALLNQIEKDAVGADIQTKMRGYVKRLHRASGVRYVALGGDDTVVPVRRCSARGRNDLPTDLYYADMDGGTWDADRDGLYGESEEITTAHLTPEIAVGRIPVRTAKQASDYAAKVVRYESVDSEGFANSMLIVTGNAVNPRNRYSGPERPAGFRTHDPVAGGEIGLLTYYRESIQPLWQAVPMHGFFSTKSPWDVKRCGDYDLTGPHILERLDAGYHHVVFSGHATPGRWAIEGKSFTKKHAAALSNRIPFVVRSGGCALAAFDDPPDPGLPEVLLRNPKGGAVVLFGYSRAVHEGTHQDELYRELFKSPPRIVGDAFRACKRTLAPKYVGHPYHQYIYNLLGDPATVLLRDDRGRKLQLIEPNGLEFLPVGSDVEVRWGAAGTDFAADETVALEYSRNAGATWMAVPEASRLHYSLACHVWRNCPLPAGNRYRLRVLACADRAVSDASDRSFSIGQAGSLRIMSRPCDDVLVRGVAPNCTPYTCEVPVGSSVELRAPARTQGLRFVEWRDRSGASLSRKRVVRLEVEGHHQFTAVYSFPGTTLGATGTLVTHTTPERVGCSVWKIHYLFSPGDRILVKIQHAAPGPNGAFCHTVWADTDSDGIPDALHGMSPVKEVQVAGEWSSHEFAVPEAAELFVGYTRLRPAKVFYQQGEGDGLAGYVGLDDRVFYTKSREGTPRRSRRHRYSNIVVRVLEGRSRSSSPADN